MDTTRDGTMRDRLTARVVELERANARLHAEVAALRAERGGPGSAAPERPSRRGLLRTALATAAATVGTGVLLTTQDGTASANGTETATTFTSGVASTPAVTAQGSNGAQGIAATSDTAAAIEAVSSSGHGVLAFSASNMGIHGKSSSGPGVVGQSKSFRGGQFGGGAAALQLLPSSAPTHPTSGQRGDLVVDAGGNLWYCKVGGSTATWVQLA